MKESIRELSNNMSAIMTKLMTLEIREEHDDNLTTTEYKSSCPHTVEPAKLNHLWPCHPSHQTALQEHPSPE